MRPLDVIEADLKGLPDGPWDAVSESTNNVHETPHAAVCVPSRRDGSPDTRWQTIVDTLNSDLSSIEREPDDDGGYVFFDGFGFSICKFLANARTDVPDLIAEVRRLQGRLDGAHRLLNWAAVQFRHLVREYPGLQGAILRGIELELTSPLDGPPPPDDPVITRAAEVERELAQANAELSQELDGAAAELARLREMVCTLASAFEAARDRLALGPHALGQGLSWHGAALDEAERIAEHWFDLLQESFDHARAGWEQEASRIDRERQ